MPGPRRQVLPRVVVGEKLKVSSPMDPFDWQLVGRNKQSRVSPGRPSQQQVPLTQDFIPLPPAGGDEQLPSSSSEGMFVPERRRSKRVAKPETPKRSCAELKRKAIHEVSQPETPNRSCAEQKRKAFHEVAQPGTPKRSCAELKRKAFHKGKAALPKVEFFPPDMASPSAWEAILMDDGFQLRMSPTCCSNIAECAFQCDGNVSSGE
ncbi:uncharacterized protein LOC115579884 [Sparus aurata]|uniref:uncharacterized protein LOC115579884 n=1 Tax=Sparus aurata TaxID=8175 RepID=UPI0011C12600|nr:uncharacterized protein LOC115579884 [Sparus aurata]